MKVYNTRTKVFELIPTQSLTPNHLLVFKDYYEMRDFDFKRFKDPLWTFCSIEVMKTTKGCHAVCGARMQLPNMHFRCDGLTYQETIEKFLDILEREGRDSL